LLDMMVWSVGSNTDESGEEYENKRYAWWNTVEGCHMAEKVLQNMDWVEGGRDLEDEEEEEEESR